MDIIEVKCHVLCNNSLGSGLNSFSILILKYIEWTVKRNEIPSSSTNEDVLFNFKVDHSDIKLTLLVANFNVSTCNFIVVENILWEMNANVNTSFITATPYVQWCSFFVDSVLLESYWRFVNHKHIFVSNKRFIMVMNFSHDGVSYLDLWLSTIVLFLPVATSWSPIW